MASGAQRGGVEEMNAIIFLGYVSGCLTTGVMIGYGLAFLFFGGV